MIQISVNGASRELPKPVCVKELLDELNLRRDSIAVAVNGEVIPAGAHSERLLCEGDIVEIIQAVGGGRDL